jgi:CO/xanthine dehydrogenase FAD-binding subunit
MSRFSYIRPNSLTEALELLADPSCRSKLLAGGTELLVFLHHQEGPQYDRLIDISRLDELKTIQRSGDIITLGGAATFTEVEHNPLVAGAAPFLVAACHSVGSLQIRNQGTLGGNVVNAAACADSLPALVCLGAEAHLASCRGQRSLPVEELVLRPNRTQLEPNEILTHFTFPIPPQGAQTAFIKLGRRNAQSISRLSMAVLGRLDGAGRVDLVRITPGAATPRTTRFTAAEDLLLGQPVSAAGLAAAAHKTAEIMLSITGQRWSTEYKEKAIVALAEQALQRVFLDGQANPV